MLNIFKRQESQPTQARTSGRQYRQVAVTPEAHAKLRLIADKLDKSIIDTVDTLVGLK